MSKIKSLAGQTAVYGVSSILGRLLNYMLVPLHTMVFSNTQDLGVVTGLYAYTAIVMVIYTFGMETAFFRFSTKNNNNDTFHITATAVIIVSTVLSVLVIFNSENIAFFTGYPDTGLFIIWIAITLWIDSILAIPFAKMRLENKARLFASVKVINILLNVSLQVFFLLLLPAKYDLGIGIGYIFLANLIANTAILTILWRWVIKIRLIFDWQQFKPILWYGLPILITGIAGMFNEQLDKILLEKLLPDNFYQNMDSTGALGVYGQTFKLSIFMMLAIQAFRYAGEPFFFSNAKDKHAPELFAKVMHYFALLSLLILVLVSLNVDLIAYIFLRNPAYRIALFLVPILLLGKFFYGIYMNLSIWFKLTDKTYYGMYFSIIGAIVTVIGNILLIPIMGYTGSALASVACYFTMAVICYTYGQKHYPIPYNFAALLPYFITTCLLIYGSWQFHYGDFIWDSGLRLLLSGVVVVVLYQLEKPSRYKKSH